ncbi:MAG: hypothetical protein U0531_17820 [Dehalococcoidia bacterium]
MIEQAAHEREAQVALIDVGPNWARSTARRSSRPNTSLSRSPPTSTRRGMRNLGLTLRRWRNEWVERRQRNPVEGAVARRADDRLGMSSCNTPCGASTGRPRYNRWMERIPAVYRAAILGQQSAPAPAVRDDLVLSGDAQALPQLDAAGAGGAQADVLPATGGRSARRPR